MNEAAPARQSLPNAQRATAFAVTLVVRAVGIEPLFYCDAVKSRFQPLHVAQRREEAPRINPFQTHKGPPHSR